VTHDHIAGKYCSCTSTVSVNRSCHLVIFTDDLKILGLANYEAMNAVEIDYLVSRYGKDERTVLLGDFNIGPADALNNVVNVGEGR